MTWTSDDLVRATGGVASAAFIADGVSIDTRTLRPGALFVALRAVRDGHDFLEDARHGGAVAALMDRDVATALPVVRVADTAAALTALGAAGRARSAARVVAVTGSVGKTTTKAMLARVLSAHGPTHAAERSFNNALGVPLTLAELPREAAFCVVEIGMNHAGEIAPLARLAQPDVAVVTAISMNHIGQLGSEVAIADEKASIARGLPQGGTLVLPADTPHLGRLRAQADGRAIVTFGIAPNATVRVAAIEAAAERVAATLLIGGRPVRVALGAPGTHMALNAAAAVAVAVALGADAEISARALDGFAALSGRGARRELMVGDYRVLLLDDSYNASPASVRAALSVLQAQQGRRIAVLGDMLEMGAFARDAHLSLAEPAVRAADLVFACGLETRAMFEALPPRARGAHADTAEALAPAVRDAVRAGDAVLVKGSFGMRMRAIVDVLEGRT